MMSPFTKHELRYMLSTLECESHNRKHLGLTEKPITNKVIKKLKQQIINHGVNNESRKTKNS